MLCRIPFLVLESNPLFVLTNIRSKRLAEYLAKRVGYVILGQSPNDSNKSKNWP